MPEEEVLQQVIIQQTSGNEVRAFAQYGQPGEYQPVERQVEISYDSLSQSEKDVWDACIEMIKAE